MLNVCMHGATLDTNQLDNFQKNPSSMKGADESLAHFPHTTLSPSSVAL